MICVCGHSRQDHETSCRVFMCCRAEWRRDDNHDFITHQQTRCGCAEYRQPVAEVTVIDAEPAQDPTATLALCKWLKDRIKEWEADAKAALNMLPGERKAATVAGQQIGLVTLTKGRRTATVLDERALLAYVQEHHPTEIEPQVRKSFRDVVLKLAMERGGVIVDRDGVVHDGIVGITEGEAYPMTRLDSLADQTIAGLLAAGRIDGNGIKTITEGSSNE